MKSNPITIIAVAFIIIALIDFIGAFVFAIITTSKLYKKCKVEKTKYLTAMNDLANRISLIVKALPSTLSKSDPKVVFIADLAKKLRDDVSKITEVDFMSISAEKLFYRKFGEAIKRLKNYEGWSDSPIKGNVK